MTPEHPHIAETHRTPAGVVRRRIALAALLLAVWSIPAVLFATILSMQLRNAGIEHSWAQVFLVRCNEWYVWAALTPVIFWIVRRAPLRVRVSPGTVTTHVLAGLAIAAFCMTESMAVLFLATRGPGDWSGFGAMLVAALPIDVTARLLVYGVVVSVASAIDNARCAHEQSLRTSQMQAQLALARLEALRARIHPHFLFNTLNIVTSLIRKREHNQAVEMIARLSELLRRVLRDDQQELIPLEQELAYIREYLEIESVRFGDRMRVEIHVEPDATRAEIPTLLLQPIVENAIHHGIAEISHPGRVRIEAGTDNGLLKLVVRNDGPPLDACAAADAEGIGLSSTRHRLRERYQDRSAFHIGPGPEGGAVVTMSFPFRPCPDS